MSDEQWNFKTNNDDLIHIENISKTKVLATASDGQVILDDLEEDKAEQLWRVGETDAEGYCMLESSVVPKTETVPKVLTAISESGLEIKHLRHLNKKQMKSFPLERTANGATLKRTHKYFYQVQAQMEVTGLSETVFIV